MLLLLGIYGLPLLWSRPLPPEHLVAIEMITVSKKTNLKPRASAAKKEAERPKPAAAPVPEAAPTPKPAVTAPTKPEPAPEPKPEPKPVETPPEPVTVAPPTPTPPDAPKPPAARPIKRPPPQKEVQEVKKEEPEEFDALLKTLEAAAKAKSAKAEKDATPEPPELEDPNTPKTRSNSDFDPDQELSVSVKDAIRSQLAKCWSVNNGAQDVGGMTVTLRITLESDGTVIGIKKLGGNAAKGSASFYRAFEESAFRAVQKCSPLQSLPKELYQSWREIDFLFDPREMFY